MLLGIGGVVVDRIIVIPEMPQWNTVIYSQQFSLQQGGMVATALAAASRLGMTAEFIGGIGNDETGQYIQAQFKKNNIKMNRINIFKNENSAFSMVLVNQKNGLRTIIHEKGVQKNDCLLNNEIDLTGIQYLHLDGYWLDTVLKTVKIAKKRQITTFLDPSSKLIADQRAWQLFPLIDFFIASYQFAVKLTGESVPLSACEKISNLGLKKIIITKGEQGCFIYSAGLIRHIPAFKINAIDTTGAGDVFHGAFIAGHARGLDLIQAVQFASAVAAIKCTKIGGQAGIPGLSETLTFLKNNRITINLNL